MTQVRWGLLLLVAALAVGGTALTTGGWAVRSWSLGLASQMIIAAAMAWTLAVGGIDLALGATILVSSALTKASGPLAGILGGVTVGIVHASLLASGRRSATLVTLASALAAVGLVTYGPEQRLVPTQIDPGLDPLLALVLAAAILVITQAILARSPLGRVGLAISADAERANQLGLPVVPVRALAYLMSATLAAVVGVLPTPDGGPQTLDSAWLVPAEALAAVTLGGLLARDGTVDVAPGAALGAAVVWSLHALWLAAGFFPEVWPVGAGAILAAALLLTPGKRFRENLR